MTQVCMVMADGFEEIEAVTIIDVLRRAEIEVTVLGLESSRVVGAHGIAVEADAPLKDAPEIAWDLVVLPGGMPNATHLRDSLPLRTFLTDQAARGGRLGATSVPHPSFWAPRASWRARRPLATLDSRRVSSARPPSRSEWSRTGRSSPAGDRERPWTSPWPWFRPSRGPPPSSS